MTQQPIESFEGEFRFLSNFWPCSGFTTVEHEFQAAKFSSEAARERILSQTTPGRAKRLARKMVAEGEPMQSEWDTIRPQVMLELLRRKFADVPLRQLLLGTGERRIVEGNTWHDQFWGVCTCQEHRGEGQNTLGTLLMQIRDEIRGVQPSLPPL